MKIVKKIFVGALVVAMLASCLAVSISAEDPKLPLDDIYEVLEYRFDYDIYLAESYDELNEGDFVFEPKHFDGNGDPFFEFVSDGAAALAVVADGDNRLLKITNSSSDAVGYKLYNAHAIPLTTTLITSFDFQLGDEGGENGSDISLVATLADYFEEITLFSASASADAATITYAEYVSNRVIYKEVESDAQLNVGDWYHVDIAYCLKETEDGMFAPYYELTLTSDGDEILSFENPVSVSSGVDSLKLYVNGGEDADPAVTYLDNLFVYEGTVARDVLDPENTLADIIIAMDAYGRSDISVEDMLVVADVYEKLYFGETYGIEYEPPVDIEKYVEVAKIVSRADDYVVQAYAHALIKYSKGIFEYNDNYSARVDYIEKVASQYYDLFKSIEDHVPFMPGMNDEYATDVTFAKAVANAIELYENSCAELEKTASYSANFVKILEEDYDPSVKDYTVLMAKYGNLSALKTKADATYRYADVNPNTKYPYVADVMAVYDALEARMMDIESCVKTFSGAVAKLNKVEAPSVSAENPYLTTNFSELYENYQIANAVFANGTVHPTLDPATYPGLSEKIAVFNEYKNYVDARVLDCTNFIAIVNGASTSTYYVTVKAQLEQAKLYLDGNKQYSLEKYEGVEEAIAQYEVLVEKIEADIKNAAAYIAAVDAINLNASYNALKAKVAAANKLKASGAIIGIEGIKEANVKLEKAQSKLNTLEAYSYTLVNTVNALEEAETLKERRELIFAALAVKDNAENQISGVSAAKTELQEQIEAYNEDVEAMNELFGITIEGACIISNSVVSSTNAVNVTSGVIGATK